MLYAVNRTALPDGSSVYFKHTHVHVSQQSNQNSAHVVAVLNHVLQLHYAATWDKSLGVCKTECFIFRFFWVL